MGKRGPPAFGCFRARISVPQGIPHAFRWSLLSTRTLCNATLCDRNATRGEELGPLSLRCEGQHACGTSRRTQVCSHTQKGSESSSAMLPVVRCGINFHNRVENPGNVAGIQSFVLDLFFHVCSYFYFPFARTRHRIRAQTWFWHLSQSRGIF